MSRRNTRIRPALKGAALVAAALAAAGGAAGTALAVAAGPVGPAGPASHPAKARTASLVPLRSVGLGWSIAEYSTATLHTKGKTTLYAVSPQGSKFAFYNWPASKPGPGTFYLVDWSGDGQRVLVSNFFGKLEQISLATGKVINTFKLPAGATALSYTRPNGLNVLAAVNGGIARYDLTGKLTQKLTKPGGIAIESPDGASVIVDSRSGIEQVSNLGGVIKRLHPPVPTFGCSPVRWWNSTTVLAECNARSGSGAPRLWLFPINGGRVRALTAQRNGRGIDQGDIAAWQLTSGVYLQALGPCGVVFIAKQAPNGQAHQVVIPGVKYASDHIITGHGSSLLVQAADGCAVGASLLWFNPGTKKVTWVIHAHGNINGVTAVVPFGRPLS